MGSQLESLTWLQRTRILCHSKIVFLKCQFCYKLHCCVEEIFKLYYSEFAQIPTHVNPQYMHYCKDSITGNENAVPEIKWMEGNVYMKIIICSLKIYFSYVLPYKESTPVEQNRVCSFFTVPRKLIMSKYTKI